MKMFRVKQNRVLVGYCHHWQNQESAKMFHVKHFVPDFSIGSVIVPHNIVSQNP